MIELYLDKMFSVESLGLSEEVDCLSTYDPQKLKEFENAVEF